MAIPTLNHKFFISQESNVKKLVGVATLPSSFPPSGNCHSVQPLSAHKAILAMKCSAVPSHEINFCFLIDLGNSSWIDSTIRSFLCKALLAPQKGSEITKILVHLILANFLVSQRPKQDRENRDGLPGCSKAWRLKSWGSEATPSATHSIRIVYDQVSVLIRAENFLSETETFFFKQIHFFSSFPTS